MEPLLPDRTPARGSRWMDHRLVVDGVLWRTRAVAAWRELPACYGNWKTVYNRHRRWSGDGTWPVVLSSLRTDCDKTETDEWVVGVDATVIRARHHAAGAGTNHPRTSPSTCWPRSCWRPRSGSRRTQGEPPNYTNCGDQPGEAPDREGLGRSRGGVPTKIHVAADSQCRPVGRVVSAGQRHDSLAFAAVMADIQILRSCGARSRTPDRVLADKAYSSSRIRKGYGAGASRRPSRNRSTR